MPAVFTYIVVECPLTQIKIETLHSTVHDLFLNLHCRSLDCRVCTPWLGILNMKWKHSMTKNKKGETFVYRIMKEIFFVCPGFISEFVRNSVPLLERGFGTL